MLPAVGELQLAPEPGRSEWPRTSCFLSVVTTQ
jgi:hypothetical protein